MVSVSVNANGRKHLKKKLTELSLCVSASEVRHVARILCGGRGGVHLGSEDTCTDL